MSKETAFLIFCLENYNVFKAFDFRALFFML